MTEPNENQSSLCFDLRDKKIAAVLRSHWPGECTDTDEDESPIDHLADTVIRELKIAKACEGGCVWQIPNRVEDMTQAQRELLGMMTDPAQKIADSTRRDHLGPFTDPEKFAE